jgi:hypothetical protein
VLNAPGHRNVPGKEGGPAGTAGDYSFVGDWDCDGIDTPGLYRQTDGFAHLRNTNSFGVADVSFFFGVAGDIPIAGELRRRWV